MVASTHTVLVVGAGVAGLHATATLAAAGLDVLCLEARDRVGGRLLSVGAHTDAGHSRDGGGYLDLGAAWFWAGERRVQSLIARFGIGVFAQHTTGDGLYAIGPQDLRGPRECSRLVASPRSCQQYC